MHTKAEIAATRALSPKTANRILIEEKVCTEVVKCLLKAGYLISVFDGEEETLIKSVNLKEICGALMTTDEDWLYVEKDGSSRKLVFFVYGNSGWDVISDWSVGLDEVLKPVIDACELEEFKE